METQTIGLAVAFIAGILSFLSPCVLPLVPSYASLITGMSLEELTARDESATGRRRALLLNGGFFILGFSAVFIALGASATLLGSLFARYSDWVGRIGGVFIMLLGLHVLGVLRIPGAARERRFQFGGRPAGLTGSGLAGVAFGAGWTPCIGPVLGAILTLSATRGSLGEGVALLSVYSAGLAVPFLATTLALDRFLGALRRFRRWLPWVSRVSGALLLLVGALLASGAFTLLASYLARLTPAFLLEYL